MNQSLFNVLLLCLLIATTKACIFIDVLHSAALNITHKSCSCGHAQTDACKKPGQIWKTMTLMLCAAGDSLFRDGGHFGYCSTSWGEKKGLKTAA